MTELFEVTDKVLCYKCSDFYDENHFHDYNIRKRRNSKGERTGICKDCTRHRSNMWRVKNIGKARAYDNWRNATRKRMT